MLIAEFCQNHNGNKEILFDMIWKAKRSGADACKIQSFFADDLSPEFSFDYDRLKGLELSWDIQAEFCKEVKSLEMIPITSVYTTKYTTLLKECGFEHIKIGSAQSKDKALILHYMNEGFKVHISTGGHELQSVDLYPGAQCVYHCVSEYPSTPKNANLFRMIELAQKLGSKIIGFSDHTDPTCADWDYPIRIAIALSRFYGLSPIYIEKHFTILPRNRTKDGPVSVFPEQLKEIKNWMVKSDAEIFGELPYIGTIFGRQDAKEIGTIERYKRRWKAVDAK